MNRNQDKWKQIIFHSAYLHFLNPIENVFSKWKERIRCLGVQNEEMIMRGFEYEGRNITQSDCSVYYRQMFGFVRRCERGKEIFGGKCLKHTGFFN
jgi:hypothetical protein